MSINWNKYIYKDRGKLLFGGFFFFVAAFALLFSYFNKERLKSKNDIIFLNGPFKEYSWASFGGRSGSSLTFQLQNYRNTFKIKADFFSILQKNEFKAIQLGDTLTIGIPKSFIKSPNSIKKQYFVYSISSRNNDYLDLNKTLSKHNTPLFLYGAGLFLILGSALVYLARKVKTPIF